MSYSLRQNLAFAGNFTAGRLGNPINKIFIHHAATTDFDGIARTFQHVGRGASAHYGVGRNKNVDQYVPEGSIAWHCGNWPYNATSIGIENVNSSGGPEWNVADQTFDTLVELVHDIAARHGMLPLKVGKNLFGHKDVSATACPGKLYGRLQELADKVNKMGGGSSNPTPAPSRKSNDQIATEVLAGKWGNGPDRQRNLAAAGYDYGVIQGIVNARLGGGSAPAPKASVTTVANQVLAGAWGNGPDRKARLEKAGYNYQAVQDEVNRLLGVKSAPAAPARKANEQVAREVVRGEWGNGPDRKARLQRAGYDYNAVQAIVNRLI